MLVFKCGGLVNKKKDHALLILQGDIIDRAMTKKKDPVAEMFEQVARVLYEAGMVIREAMGIGGKFEITSVLRTIRLGGYIGTSIALGVLGGLWLDNELDTNPLFVFIGLALGLAVAIFGTYWRLKPFTHKKDHKTDKKRKGE